MPEPEDRRLDGSKLKKLAKFATKKDDANETIKKFRADASAKNGFRSAFQSALNQYPGELDALSEAEISFCEGWALLARHGLDHWWSSFDAELVDAINAHVKEFDDDPHIMSG